MKRFTLYFLLIWPFIWDNATQAYHNAQIIQISKTYLQLLETGTISFLVLYILLCKKPGKMDLKFILPPAGIALVGFISGIMNGSYITGYIQVTYLLLRPFLVFFILANLGLERNDLVKGFRFYLVVAVLNAVICIGQFALFGVDADHAAGLLYHAHSLSNVMAVCIFFTVSYAVVRKRRKVLLLILLFFPPIIIGAHQKTLVLLMPVLLVLYLIMGRGNLLHYIRLAFAFLAFFALGYYAIATYSPSTVQLSRIAIENIDRLGAIRAYKTLFSVFDEIPESVPFGLGPGNYGSIYNILGTGAENRKKKEYAREIYYGSTMVATPGKRPSIWAPRPNLYLAVLSEYGLTGILLFLWVLYQILRMLFRFYHSRLLDIELKWLSLGTFLGLIYILMLGGIYILSGYNSQANMFPLIVMAALLYSTVRAEFSRKLPVENGVELTDSE